MTDALAALDHLVLAAPDLDGGIALVEERLGLRAAPGGRHPGAGTRNALLALGPASYLEIVAPDPEQETPALPRLFGIDGLAAPRLATWAARTSDVAGIVETASARGVALGAVAAGRRRRADGALLAWSFTDPRVVVAGGIVPFFIDWGASPHPALSAAPGAALLALRAEHPDPEHVRALLARLGIDLEVTFGPAPGFVATLASPRGRVELR